MPRASTIVIFIRVCLVVLALTVGVLVFGPFSGAETKFDLTDKEAHALAFYALTALSLMALPRIRKWDVALACFALGGLIEVIQPMVGRDGDILDWLADSAGVLLCVLPMSFQALRSAARQEDNPERYYRRRRTDRRHDIPAEPSVGK